MTAHGHTEPYAWYDAKQHFWHQAPAQSKTTINILTLNFPNLTNSNSRNPHPHSVYAQNPLQPLALSLASRPYLWPLSTSTLCQWHSLAELKFRQAVCRVACNSPLLGLQAFETGPASGGLPKGSFNLTTMQAATCNAMLWKSLNRKIVRSSAASTSVLETWVQSIACLFH